MYKVYLLENKDKKWYIGYTPASVIKRPEKHNKGEVQSTKAFLPWKLIYCEVYIDREDATAREKFLKSGAGRIYLKKQLRHYLNFTGSHRSNKVSSTGSPRANEVSYTRATSSTGRAPPS